MTDTETPEKKGWFRRLKDGLARTSTKIADGIGEDGALCVRMGQALRRVHAGDVSVRAS